MKKIGVLNMDKNQKKLLIISILLLAISFTLIPINLDKVRIKVIILRKARAANF